MEGFVISKLAESVLSQAVQRIADLLVYEAASLKSVRDDVVLLEDDLRSLQDFLQYADSNQEHNQRLRDLVIRVRDVASDAEDAVGTFIYKVSSSAYIMRASHNKKIRAQINHNRSRIQIISRSIQVYDIKLVVGAGTGSTASSMVDDQVVQQNLIRRSFPDDEDKDLIILEGPTNTLKGRLTSEEDPSWAISVVGMGGLGKTTLAKKAYNGVKQHFDCCAWVFISQQFVSKDVLIDILIQVGIPEDERARLEREKDEKLRLERDKYGRKNLEQMKSDLELLNAFEEHRITRILKDRLGHKRYLVVLDDIWRTEAWDRVKCAFPKGKKGSKLLLTTRNEQVATHVHPSSFCIEPPFLDRDQSWELLRRKAYPEDTHGEKDCPVEFEKLGKEMVEKCGGLPLAVVVLGGLLKTKNYSLDEWKVVHENVKALFKKLQSKQQHGGVHEILALSYYDLPYTLKPCFLYLGNFPEDWEIKASKLIRLWIAEGFIPTPRRGEEEETLETLAKQYLTELSHRGMVQVSRRGYTGVGIKACRMHDLMRDFCISKAREENFSEIILHHKNGSCGSSNQHVATTHSRKIVISPSCDLDFHTNGLCRLLGRNPEYASWREQIHPNLRSILCFGTLSVSAFVAKDFMMLRVLEIGNVKGIPSEIGNLIHLKHLCLESARYHELELPNSIGNLRNLHTLDVKHCPRLILPSGVFTKLLRLRHLLLPTFYYCRRSSYFEVDKLTNIVTLKYIPPGCLLKKDALLKLTNLQHLGISTFIESRREILGSSIFRSGCLPSSNLDSDRMITSLAQISSCRFLSKLILLGTISERLQILPENLNKLVLGYSLLEHDPMTVLEKLSNLRFLRLGFNSCWGNKLVCSADGFPKLETLQLVGLFNLTEWHVEEGALQSLKRLDIERLPQMETTPDGWRFLTSLKELNITKMNKSFCERLQVKDGIQGEDFYKVAHIPSISISDIL